MWPGVIASPLRFLAQRPEAEPRKEAGRSQIFPFSVPSQRWVEGASSESPHVLQPAPEPTISGPRAAGQLLRNSGALSVLPQLFLASPVCAGEQGWDFLPSEHVLHLVLFAVFMGGGTPSLQGRRLLATESGPPQSSGTTPSAPHHGPGPGLATLHVGTQGVFILAL